MTHILIVSGKFYNDIAEEMSKGAIETLQLAGATYEEITVPGAFEIPGVVRMALDTGKYDGYVALGCVIRGETTHYDYVCGESARGLMDLAVQHSAAIGYGILTVENEAQAWERARVTDGNKGRDAAQACLAIINIKKKLQK
jgi:6,7-dimethyl-8-ribityllumazine synthase